MALSAFFCMRDVQVPQLFESLKYFESLDLKTVVFVLLPNTDMTIWFTKADVGCSGQEKVV